MQSIFGGVIAVLLLGLWVHFIRVATLIVHCSLVKDCSAYPSTMFTDSMAQALATIGGLVSALVIAELAITKPGELPAMRAFSVTAAGGKPPNLLKVISVVYILVWIAGGFWAFIQGVYHPTVVPALTTLGQAWLGLAVAAGYSYFGLQRQS
jgi:hypothetical protein